MEEFAWDAFVVVCVLVAICNTGLFVFRVVDWFKSKP